MFKTSACIAIVFFLLTSMVIFSSSCKKNICNKGETFDYGSFSNCHEAQNPTSDMLKKNIAGSWTYVNYMGGMGKISPNTENVFLQIESTGTFILKENDVVTSEGEWDITTHNLGGYVFSTGTDNSYTSGEVSLCDNQLMFSTAKVDGPTYFFARSK